MRRLRTTHARWGWAFVLAVLPTGVGLAAEGDPSLPGVLAAKTMFQTNAAYDPRIAVAVDAVIVHQHGADGPTLQRVIASWREHGFPVGRMFFADSDATNEYWTGKWDGTEHADEVERDASGQVVMCAGIRPYMLPTAGWTAYLREMAAGSVSAGAEAVLPEEPLAHVHTGYEAAFREAWARRYGRAWEPENASPVARFLTAQLKNELYLKLQSDLAHTTRQHAAQAGRRIPFIYPVHSLYSNLASLLVAPLGTSTGIDGLDGYIGQVWTGPVNWALANYGSPNKSFFASAYALYDYFVELARGTDKKLWLLIDPVEDDPRHTWAEFEEWYRHCVAAALMFPATDAFEVMPWPDRIFLPGHATGGGTPAPERFRVLVLSAVQVQQEVPRGGEWLDGEGRPIALGRGAIGAAVADTALWHRQESPRLQGLYSLLMPLVQDGIPVASCLMERWSDRGYLDQFRVIVLSYEDLSPIEPAMHEALAEWVRRGGSLIVLGNAPDLRDASFWWTKTAAGDPLRHLLTDTFGMRVDEEADRPVGQGRVYRRAGSPRRFADPAIARAEYLPLIENAWLAASATSGARASTSTSSRSTDTCPGAPPAADRGSTVGQPAEPFRSTGGFCMRRGPFVMTHALGRPMRLHGPMVDLFDPAFPVLDQVELAAGASGLYRDVRELMRSADNDAIPRVLHTTHRLMAVRARADGIEVVIRGPAETPAVVRVCLGRRKMPPSVLASDHEGRPITVDWRVEGRTLLARFPNDPAGVTLRIR